MTDQELGQLNDEVRHGGRAHEILTNETFKDAVRQVEEAILYGMKDAAIVDEKLRLRLLDRYELLQSLLGVLTSTMHTGQFAKEQLEAEAKKSLMERALTAVGWR